MANKSYMQMLKESLIQEMDVENPPKKPTDSGPMIDPILNYNGNGEMETHKDVASVLERYYFNEKYDKGISVIEEQNKTEDEETKKEEEAEEKVESKKAVKESKKNVKEQDEEDDEEDEDEDEDMEESKKIKKENTVEEMEQAVIEKLISEMDEEEKEEEKLDVDKEVKENKKIKTESNISINEVEKIISDFESDSILSEAKKSLTELSESSK